MYVELRTVNELFDHVENSSDDYSQTISFGEVQSTINITLLIDFNSISSDILSLSFGLLKKIISFCVLDLVDAL